MSLATRCPWCETVFRLTKEQAAVRAGLARCGICNHTFNALDYLVREAEVGAHVEYPRPARSEAIDPQIEKAYEDSLRDFANASPQWHAAPAESEEVPVTAAPDDLESEPTEAPSGVESAFVPTFMRAQDRDERPRMSLAARLGWAIGSALAFLVLCAQLAFYWRGELLAHFPGTYGPLAHACEMLGCSTQFVPHDIRMISIESSALEPVTNRRDTVMFTTLLRNSSPVVERYPDLELTLTDAQDKPAVRRVLTPAEYLAPTQRTRINQGLAANSELPVKVVFEVASMPVAGYRAGIFYP